MKFGITLSPPSLALGICFHLWWNVIPFSSVQYSCSIVSDSLLPDESQHARPLGPSQTPRVYSNSCPLSRWCHPTVSFSVVLFSSCPQSLPASGSFPMSQLFAWGGQSIRVSASASGFPMNTQDWSPLGWTGWISLQSLSHVQIFVTPWTAACQDSLFITNCWNLLKPISIELVMPSNHLILCHPLLLLPSIFPNLKVFSNE